MYKMKYCSILEVKVQSEWVNSGADSDALLSDTLAGSDAGMQLDIKLKKNNNPLLCSCLFMIFCNSSFY